MQDKQEFKLRELEEYVEEHLKKIRTEANRRVQEIRNAAEEQSKKMYQDRKRKEVVSQESEKEGAKEKSDAGYTSE
jgi:vacuolar-type H+-ATPase subunit H